MPLKKRPKEHRDGQGTPAAPDAAPDTTGGDQAAERVPMPGRRSVSTPSPDRDSTPLHDPTSEPAPEPAPARRGRPRSEAAERSIIEATLSLVEAGVPLSELSIERIARTAGVGKATIYRRWEGKEALLVDVVRSLDPDDPPAPGASVREDLIFLMQSLHRRGLAKRSSALLVTVFSQMQNYPRLWEMHHRVSVQPRRRQMDEVLRRGIAEGEIRDDLDFDLLGDLFVGPILVRTVLRPEVTWSQDSAEQIVDAVLAGLRPPKSPGGSAHDTGR